MASIFVTRRIPDIGIALLRAAGHEVEVSSKDGVLTKEELRHALSQKPYDAVLCLLTDTIDAEIYDAVPSAKIFANYAVGYNNIDVAGAKERGVVITNTPGVLVDTVAEFTIALMLATVKRIPESDRFTRMGKYVGWAPELFLGGDLKGKTLGVLGAGRIGVGVAVRAHKGFGMNVIYHDVAPNTAMEKEIPCEYHTSLETLLKASDVVTIHVPLLESTKHLLNTERIALMKPTAYLINTSRGPIVDEVALVDALERGVIRGAGLDVFEHEPELAKGLAMLSNVVITPHIASASEETRSKMSEIASQDIIDFLKGEVPQHVVTP